MRIRGLQYVVLKSFALRKFWISPFTSTTTTTTTTTATTTATVFKYYTQLGSMKYLMMATFNFKIYHVSFITTWKVSWVISGLGGGANGILEQFQTILKCMGCL